MKIINEKGKLFGLINLIDFFVICAILLITCLSIMKILGNVLPSDKSTDNLISIKFTVKARDEDKSIIRKYKKGQKLLSDEKELDAEIISYKSEPAKIEVFDSEGNMKIIKHPENKDLFVNVKANVQEGNLFYKLDKQDIFSGSTFYLKTKNTYLKGFIIEIDD